MTAPRCPICDGPRCAEEAKLGGTAILHCAACSHRFARSGEPVDYDERYREGSYRQALIDRTRASAAAGSLEQMHEPFFRVLAPFGEARLLEAACGTGRFAVQAARRGWHVTGCDLSETAISVARELFGAQVRFEVADAAHAPQGPFEVAAAIEFLEHTARPAETLRELVSRVRPGGFVYVTVPNWGSRGVRTSTNPDWIPPVHVQFFTRASLRLLVKRAAGVAAGGVRTGFIPAIRSPFPLSQFFGNQPDGLWALARIDR